MKWKPKFFIVYPDKMIHQIKWTDNWGCHSVSNLPEMLREILNVSTIGTEWKLIWNNNHRWQVIEQNNIFSQELDDYLKADCSMLSFSAKGTMNKTAKLLIELGADNIICVDNYRDMILQQAFFKNNKNFLI
jgi:nucleoid-associated protein YejK